MTTKKTAGATSSAKQAASRALEFLNAAERAEAADAQRCTKFIDQQRAELSPKLDAWERGPTGNNNATEPRTSDGCSLAQLQERTEWEASRPQIVAPVIERARQIVQGASKKKNAMDFYNVIQAERAIFPSDELGKLRSNEARTAFDQAFKRPE